MGFVVLVIVALMAASVQHGYLVDWPVAPDLPLALAAWAIAGGGARWMLLRAWLVGAMRDLADPASLCFHAVAYTVFALLFLPVRGVVYRGRGISWAFLASGGSLTLRWADRWWIGLDPFADFTTGLLVAICTGLAALAIGWLMQGLPIWLRPVETGETDRQLR